MSELGMTAWSCDLGRSDKPLSDLLVTSHVEVLEREARFAIHSKLNGFLQFLKTQLEVEGSVAQHSYEFVTHPDDSIG